MYNYREIKSAILESCQWRHIRLQLLAYVERLEVQNIPVIFDLQHLSRITGVKLFVLSNICNKPEKFYYSYNIPKRSGGIREINMPQPILLELQRWIYREILSKQTFSDESYGFVKRRSIVDNAKVHANSKELLKLDIVDFFGTIKFHRILSFFHHIGYLGKIAYYLSSFCCLDNKLPQGAAASPAISNLIAKRLDKRLICLCARHSIRYTRYADDLSFSGRRIPLFFLPAVKDIVACEGFKVNDKKTRLIRGRNKKKVVTGISVADDQIKLPRRYKRALKQEIYETLRESNSYVDGNITDVFFLERLYGKINFWLQVEPENMFAKESFHRLKLLEENLSKTFLKNL